MRHLIIDRRGLKLDYEQQCILVRSVDGLLQSVPIRQLNQVICLHGVDVSTRLIGQLQKNGIDFVVLNQRYANCSFSVVADQVGLVARRCVQYNWQANLAQRLPVAIAICKHKIKVCQRVTQADFDDDSFASLLESMTQAVEDNQLRGLEGAGQRRMFEWMRQKLPPSIGFTTRQRRPPPDPVNSVLSFTYMILINEAIRQCKAVALDTQLGFYHRVYSQLHSLACDLIEPLRPYVEEWTLRMFLKKLFVPEDFTRSSSGCLLHKKGRYKFYALYNDVCPEWQLRLKANAKWLAHLIDKSLSAA